MEEKVLVVKKEWCKGCGICVDLCPKQVLDLKDGKVYIANLEACIKCDLCGKLCPDFAVGMQPVCK